MSGSAVVGAGRLAWLGGWVVGLAAWWLVGGGIAWATTGHSFVGEFGGSGGSDGQFNEPLGNGPRGLAVMPSTGDVVTLDGANARVQRFDASGVFQSSFAVPGSYNLTGGIAASPANAVYVGANNNSIDPVRGAVAKFDTSGALAYELDDSTSGTTLNSPVVATSLVAVDPGDGTVYALATDSTTFGQVIDSFDAATGAFIASFDGSNGSPDGGFVCPSGLAVDGSHRVYVLDSCKGPGGRVDQYSATGVFGGVVDDGSRGAPSALAVDPVSGEVYVSEAGPTGVQVTQFSPGGAGVVYTFDASSNVSGVRALAVGGDGTAYVSDATRPFVERFGPFAGPTVTTGNASSIEARSAVLEGTIDAEGVSSTYHFEYSTDGVHWSSTPEVSAGGGTGAVAASATVSGLSPNTAYSYRLVGSNPSGSIVGASVPFTTLTAPPVVDGSVGSPSPAFASAITSRSARLHGTVNASNSFASWHFEYGTTTAYGATAPVPDGFAFGGADQPVFADLTSLEPATVYHFRLVASDLFGAFPPAVGTDQTFVTAPAASGGATGVTAGRATLTGTINPHGVGTSYHFNYGLTDSYGSSTPEVMAGSGNADQRVSQAVSGLLPDTTYHVQVVATSADGVIRSGGDGLFRTAPGPTATVVGPTGVSTDAATVAGDVHTFGLTGSYHFDVWSLDGSYTIATPERAVSGYASAERVSAALSGLPPGKTFAVQLTVASNDSTDVSDVATFATAALPKVFPTPPASDDASVYGCGSPRLVALSSRPKPGDTIRITGQDLGVGGNVVLGDRALKPIDWSASGFAIVVPDDAAGTLALTANCGHQSNTIAVGIFQEPDNHFSVASRSVRGTTATLKLKLPGPGKLESFGAGTQASRVTVKKPGTTAIKVKLTNSGVRALRRATSHSLRVKARVRFTPAGGRSASKTVTITFKRGGGR